VSDAYIADHTPVVDSVIIVDAAIIVVVDSIVGAAYI
jgi:hypothetical protein